MSAALPLPPYPALAAYEKLANDLRSACSTSQASALPEWALPWVQRGDRCTLSDAQAFLAEAHGLTDWAGFASLVEGLTQPDSPVFRFEAAVDAIVTGDQATLQQLLQQNPELAQARSPRAHRSTLLHYVSANGVEDFRQKTPPNIVAITQLLLNAGAAVNAESEAYDGHSTAFGLAATSCHPANAGVQLPLLEVLLAHGAVIDGPDGGSHVNGCLRNGRGAAALFLAQHGARLNLEDAAGVGRLDIVRACFAEDGGLVPPSTRQQLQDGFAWACQFGHSEVAAFLLPHGRYAVREMLPDRQTGLHRAALGGHAEIVRMLLEHDSPVQVRDATHHGTPLDWALYAWRCSTKLPAETRRYCETVALLARAGARLDTPGHPGDTENWPVDSPMQAALRGEFPED
jgi:ankyrin repeat protein